MNDTPPQTEDPQDTAVEHRPGPETAAGPEPAVPAPLGVPRVPTGDAGVDARLERLADADRLTTDGHAEVYEDVHRGLRDALTALDTRQGPPVPVPVMDRPSPSSPASLSSPSSPSSTSSPYGNRS